MNVNASGGVSIATTTATPSQATQPAVEEPNELASSEVQAPPPPGLGQVVDKTV